MQLHYLAHLAELGTSDVHIMGQRATQELVKALELSQGQRVLEVGCGTGSTIVRILSEFPVSVDGLDILPGMLEVAQRRLNLSGLRSRGRLLLASAAQIPLKGRSYDRVYTEGALGFHDAQAAPAVLSEIQRVLMPGGLYVANETMWKTTVTPELVANINAACETDFGVRQAAKEPWDVDDWIGLMAQAGFRLVSADLLQNHIGRDEAEPDRFSWQLAMSNAVSLSYKARGRLLPRIRKERARYNERLTKDYAYGEHIEARLFVLKV